MILQVKVHNGKIEGHELSSYLKSLQNGNYTVTVRSMNTEPHTIPEYRNYYFYICEFLGEQSTTGYTKKQFHELFKKELLNGSSTKQMDVSEWSGFIAKVKEYVKENLNFYL